MRCALIGEKLSHSYSALIHNKFGNYSYEAVEVPPGLTDTTSPFPTKAK